MNGRVVALDDYRGAPRLRWAVEAFFSDKQLSANTRRAYSLALQALVEELGWDLPVDRLDSRGLLGVFQQRWGSARPGTWNTRLTAVHSFVSYCRRNQWMDQDPMKLIDRRRITRDQTRAIPYQDLEALWSRRDISLREKTLWRVLYETAARAGEILALNIEDMDLPRKRAVITGKGVRADRVSIVFKTSPRACGCPGRGLFVVVWLCQEVSPKLTNFVGINIGIGTDTSRGTHR